MLNKIGFLGLCLLMLISCNNTNNGETSEGNETVEAIGMFNDIEEQIYILLDNKDIWELSDETIGDFCEKDDCNGYGYAIADLDEDGYLEIIKSVYAGNGHFSFNSVYETTDDGSVIMWDNTQLNNCYSEPDLLSMEELAVCSNDSDKIKYFTDDFESWGVYGYSNRYGILEISDNSINYVEECREEITSNEDDNSCYYDEDAEISEEQFNEIMAPRNENVSAKALLWFTEITYENICDSYLCYCNVP